MFEAHDHKRATAQQRGTLKKTTVLVAVMMIIVSAAAQTYPVKTKKSKAFIDEQLQFAVEQYKMLAKRTAPGVLPRSYDAATDSVITSGPAWWCSGFYPGTLLYLYEFSKDEVLKEEAIKRLSLLEKQQFNTGTHDLGFMMYCSYGNALRLWNNEKDKQVLLNSARSLATRFTGVTGVLRSWNHGQWKYPVIIDNMMNLELLTWATRVTGDTSFRHIAVTHANTTMKNHFRKDCSSWHLVDYDPQNGGVIHKQTVQGTADTSAWARGQAWALYGYTMLYRETKITAYLQLAKRVAQFILAHPNLPADKIPYWDFDAPGIPQAKRDASAAAVIASALLELSTFTTAKKEKNTYHTAAIQILQSLSSSAYRSAAGENGGFILQHSVGNLPAHSEIDVPLTYADYYYVEALLRWREVGGKK